MAPRKRTGAAAANGKALEKTEEKMDSKDVEDSEPMEVQPKKSVKAKVAPKEKAAKKIEEESAEENVCDEDNAKPAKPAAVKRGKKTAVPKEDKNEKSEDEENDDVQETKSKPEPKKAKVAAKRGKTVEKSSEEASTGEEDTETKPTLAKEKAKKGAGTKKVATGPKRTSPRLAVEHCKSCSVFRKNALEVQSYLLKHFPDMEFEINATVPRKGSFEFVLDVDGVETIIWSGLKLGPPRRLKFPTAENLSVLVGEIKKYIH